MCSSTTLRSGFTPAMVRTREGLQDDKGWPKWLSAIPAAYAALERLPHHRLRVDLGKGERRSSRRCCSSATTSIRSTSSEIGQRASLTDGKLSVYAVAQRSRVSLLWFAARALVGRAHRELDFVTLGECETLKVWSTGDSIEIALDGEVRRLDSPLEFRIRPGALKVVTPRPATVRLAHRLCGERDALLARDDVVDRTRHHHFVDARALDERGEPARDRLGLPTAEHCRT